ncbi:hypothetical protein [Rhodococcus sp. X156]|uniref:hypothetical protein n=1 Tax=Rhodococcus sp. X156 TaxID=2499145 RepID=UPI000FD86461|nr:hypothetical protein [Rhodococcus sp. X156]
MSALSVGPFSAEYYLELADGQPLPDDATLIATETESIVGAVLTEPRRGGARTNGSSAHRLRPGLSGLGPGQG